MTMFDSRLQKGINEFGENWGTPERDFRSYQYLTGVPDGDGVILMAKVNSRSKEVCRMTSVEFDEAVRQPCAAARVSSSTYGQRYFLWHWLAERSMQKTFINTVKELQNA